MRNSGATSAASVTARVCASCRGSMEGRRSDARFCSPACKQEGWRAAHGLTPRKGRRVVLGDLEPEDEDDLDDDTEDEDDSPGQLRVPPVEVAADVWQARGATWRLVLGAGGYELRSDTEARRPPWPMTYHQARGWARVTLSTPKEAVCPPVKNSTP
jgi:hypothetical protein